MSDEVFADPILYQVSCFPLGSKHRRHFSIDVAYRKDRNTRVEGWVINEGNAGLTSPRLTTAGEWKWYGETDMEWEEWAALTMFTDLDEAIEAAKVEAAKIVVNGTTVTDVKTGKFDE